MRHVEVRRLGVVDSLVLRLKLAMRRMPVPRPKSPVRGIDDLTPHQLRDIGLHGFERGFDWWRFR